MTSALDVLDNPTPMARALAAAMSDGRSLSIAEAMDPATAPEAMLPWLASNCGVKVWYDDWPIARRRQVVAEGRAAAREIGTRAAVIRLLGYVDATLVDAVAYPAPAFAGRAFAGHAWASFPPFLVIYLVSVPTSAEPAAAFAGRTFAGHAFATQFDREPFDRALTSLRAAKSPQTEARVDLRHHRPLTAGDRVTAGAGHHAGAYLPRTKL